MRELSVVGPAPTPSSVCTHCLSRSCDQLSEYKEVGTLLNSPSQGLLGERLPPYPARETSDSHSQHTSTTVSTLMTYSVNVNSKKFLKGREVGIARN